MWTVSVRSYVGTSANIVAEEKQTLQPNSQVESPPGGKLGFFLGKVWRNTFQQNHRNTIFIIRQIQMEKSSHCQVVADLVSFLEKLKTVLVFVSFPSTTQIFQDQIDQESSKCHLHIQPKLSVGIKLFRLQICDHRFVLCC